MNFQIAHTVCSIENLSSGPSYSVTGLARSQAELGANISVYSLGDQTATEASAYFDYRFENDLQQVPILKKLGASSMMHRALRDKKPDVLHTHGLWMLPNVYRAKSSAYVIAPRGMLAQVALSFSPARKRLFRLLFQDRALHNAALFHATAESEYNDIRSFGLRQPVAIIPNGIDLPTNAHPQYSTKTVLSLGRIHPKKALGTLIRAWAMIEPAFPDWSLQIVGPDEGGHAGELAVLIRELELTTVTINPPVFGDEKAELMSRVALFALSSHSENFGMTVAESLAAGVPVISTKGAPWAGLESHRCGWWIDHGVEPLTATLLNALALPEVERRAMGARGRDWVARDFSWRSMATRSLQAYAWILGQGDRPDCVMVD